MKRCEGALKKIDGSYEQCNNAAEAGLDLCLECQVLGNQAAMRHCAYKAVNHTKPEAPVEKCGDPVSVQIGRQWYCPRHGKVMMGPEIFAAEEREKRLRDVRGWLCTTCTPQLDAAILAALRAKQEVTKVEIKPCPECDKKLGGGWQIEFRFECPELKNKKFRRETAEDHWGIE